MGYEYELFSLFTLGEFTLLSYFFYLSFQTANFKKVLIGCYILFLVVFIFSFAYLRDTDFDAFPTSAEAIFTVLLSILYFWEQINDSQVTFVYGSKTFWIIIAFLLYLSANLFYYIGRFFLTPNETKALNWINSSTSLVKNVCLAVAFIYKNQGNGGTTQRKTS